MSYREDVLIQNDAIGRADVQSLMEYVSRAELRDSIVSNEAMQNSAETQWVVDKRIRDTQEVQLSESMVARINRAIDLARNVVERGGLAGRWATDPALGIMG